MGSWTLELIGRHRLATELLPAGVASALPARDCGVDLIADADMDQQAGRFVAGRSREMLPPVDPFASGRSTRASTISSSLSPGTSMDRWEGPATPPCAIHPCNETYASAN